MVRQHKWIEARRCLVCNDLNDKERKPGFIKDPNNKDKWIKCPSCNDKGYNVKSGSTKAD